MKRVLLTLAVAFIVLALAASLLIYRTVKSVPRLFARNAELKAQGYYLAEFEFKMVGVHYYLNQGQYRRAYRALQGIEDEMETTQGLLKMPSGASPEEQMAFLLDRQDPETGAFMDPDYPLFTYISPTINAIDALAGLSRQTGIPLRLKYPLRFLDRINTPDQLRSLLDSLLYMKPIWSRLPGPGPYVAASELAYFDHLEQAGVYQFSDEWKDELCRWFEQTQDPESGAWGYRIGSPGDWRQNFDINSTYHILHLLLDDQGNNRREKYPLRHAAALARNLWGRFNRPIPSDAADQHDWCLRQSQGAGILTRLLWPHLTRAEQQELQSSMSGWLIQRYRLFRPKDGGFALYLSAPRADVDGTSSAIKVLKATGSLPGTRERERLWGAALDPGPVLVRQEVATWNDAGLPAVQDLNSVRIYEDEPPAGDGYDDAGLVMICYPRDTPILDLMDLRQNLGRFLEPGGQLFGNWRSGESLRDEPLDLRREIKPVPVSRGEFQLGSIAAAHPEAERFFVIGYNGCQVPVFRLEFERAPEP